MEWMHEATSKEKKKPHVLGRKQEPYQASLLLHPQDATFLLPIPKF